MPNSPPENLTHSQQLSIFKPSRDEEASSRRERLERESADKRADEERKSAEERARVEGARVDRIVQETALQTYLDQMSKLLIERSLSSNPTPETHNVARVWTITTVRRLNGEGKGKVLQFLHESNLIQGDNPTIVLMGADLSGVDLHEGVILYKANLIAADLTRANLQRTKIDDTTRLDDKWRLVWEIVNNGKAERDLSNADLGGANLRGANLEGANLTGAKYTKETKWPAVFDPVKAGAILVESP